MTENVQRHKSGIESKMVL